MSTSGRGAAFYQTLCQQGVTVLWDEREVSAGVKLADADLIGLPYRVVVSSRTQAEGKVELKPRTGAPALTMPEAVPAVVGMPSSLSRGGA